MFERFTDRARRVVVLAQEEARQLQHNYIGTEHLLSGLVEEGDGIAGAVLVQYMDHDYVRSQIVRRIGKGPISPLGHIPFTPRCKKVLELAMREALQLGHNYIGTEHILLGLIREGGGKAVEILTSRVPPDDVRKEVLARLGAGPSYWGDQVKKAARDLELAINHAQSNLREFMKLLEEKP